MQSYFLPDKFFSILPKYWRVSKYTAMLSEFSFPIKGKNKSYFRMVNSCNGGTKEFLWEWEIIHLDIWTQLKSLQSNMFKRPQIPVQLLLYKTTTCLTRPETTFFDSKMKKKTSLK